ncbi:MAG TPA: hypothetical protein VFM93_11155 [Candidatus Limnocylindria bacterium]|nr:hypothetical protein [Candidatus Limnocylindria bacterium]
MRAAGAVLGLLAVASCAGGYGGPVHVLDCGRELYGHGEGYDERARTCLADEHGRGSRARFTTTLLTIEGDPITYAVTTAPDGLVVEVDSRDKFGYQGTATVRCTELRRVQGDRVRFVLSPCAHDRFREISF